MIVNNYALGWQPGNSRGRVVLQLADGKTAVIEVDTAEELTAMGEILRSEKSVFYSTVSGALHTDWETSFEQEEERVASA